RQLDDPDPAAFAQHRREVDALLDLAVRVDCANITVQPGRPIDGYEIEALIALTEQRLAQLGPVAQARGVTLSVEGHQGSLLEDPARAVTMMEALWPAVGFTYDPSHWAMQCIPLAETAALLSYTYHVHVRNAASHRMQASMAEGTVDFLWLVEALAASGYAGAVTIEYFNGFDPDFVETLALRDTLMGLGVTRGGCVQ
ncbi:MAG: sugar phosphate isomerase/epimerase, partial [Anaerolineae bacterium]|nr:sugar phosphate isomerase/epimerase [Anaerolineae bacterium]